MAVRTMYMILWAYTAWYAVALAGSLVGVEVLATVSPAAALAAGVIAGRRPLARQAAT
jgi:hypothetical protein